MGNYLLSERADKVLTTIYIDSFEQFGESKADFNAVYKAGHLLGLDDNIMLEEYL